MKSTPSVKPKCGDYGGGFHSTPSAEGSAPSGRRITAGDFKRNPKQKDSGPGRGTMSRNMVDDGGYGNRG